MVILMGVFWSCLFLGTLANTNVGALVLRETLLPCVLTMGALLLCPLGMLAGIGMSVARRSWTPFLLSGLNLVVSIVVFYVTLVLARNDSVIERILGKPALVSFYEGTQNFATLTLRTNGRMDVFETAWPGATDYYDGTYELAGADLRLHFKEGHAPPRLPDRAVLSGDEIRFDLDGRLWTFRIVRPRPRTGSLSDSE